MLMLIRPSLSFVPRPPPVRLTPPRSSSTSRHLTISIIAVGKPGSVSPWLASGYDAFASRLPSVLKSEWVKDDKALLSKLGKVKDKSSVTLLDERGDELTSVEFSRALNANLVKCGASVSFVVGAAEGLPREVKEGGYKKVSLGKMTLPHGLARVSRTGGHAARYLGAQEVTLIPLLTPA